jgi:hypothetical protein
MVCRWSSSFVLHFPIAGFGEYFEKRRNRTTPIVRMGASD